MTVLRSRRALVAAVLVLLAAVAVALSIARAGGGGPAEAAPTGAATVPVATGTATSTASPSVTPSTGATPSASASPSSRPTATESPTTATRPATPRTTAPAPRTTAPKPPATKKPGTSTPPPTATTSAAQAREVLRLTNIERASVGCSPLAWDAHLADAAAGHSTDMATHYYFSHTSRDGRSFSDRITDAGYEWLRIAENIAAGQPTPKAVVAAWMDSDGHRANLLDCAFTEMGVGVARSAASGNVPYWTQDLGTSG